MQSHELVIGLRDITSNMPPMIPVRSFVAFAASALALSAHGDWKRQTALVSQKGSETVVRHPGNDAVLFQNADPQLAIEWGLKNARTTVLLAGEYSVSDRIDVPRANITLIVDKDAVLRLNPDSPHTSISFKASKPDYWQMVPMLYNKGHDNVRLLVFGKLEKYKWETKERGKQTLPLMFDGRNEKGDCGLSGGMLVVTGHAVESFWLVDSSKVEVPIVALDTAPGASLVLEGCEDCHLGLIASVAPEPGGKTHETIDLNSRSIDITIERLIGERSNEIIDCNESHVVVDEVVSVGPPQKLFGRGPVSGPRFTDRRSFGSRSLDVRKTTLLKNAKSARLIHEVPKLPQALPKFTVKTTVEVTMQGGAKRRYERAVEIDLDTEPKPDSIDGLRLWLAADEGVMTEDNSKHGGSKRDVTAWADQSGNSNDVANKSADRATRPEFVPSVGGLGGKPAIQFKGKGGSNFEVTEWLLGKVGKPFDLNRATVFMVGRMDQRSTISAFTLGPNADSKIGRGGVGFRRGGNDKAWFTVHYGGPGNGKKVQSTETPLDTKHHVLSAFFDKSKASVRMSIDGKKTDATERDADSLPLLDPIRFVQIGGHGILDPPGDPGAEWFFSGQIAEIVVFNRILEQEESNTVGWYLQNKYGLKGAFVKPTAR